MADHKNVGANNLPSGPIIIPPGSNPNLANTTPQNAPILPLIVNVDSAVVDSDDESYNSSCYEEESSQDMDTSIHEESKYGVIINPTNDEAENNSIAADPASIPADLLKEEHEIVYATDSSSEDHASEDGYVKKERKEIENIPRH